MSHPISIFVDGEQITVEEHVLSADQIMIIAGLAIADHYLIEIEGKKQVSFQGKGSEPIELRDGRKFVSVFTGPTPVSHSPLTGAALFAAQLRELGYEVTELGNGHIIFCYAPELGPCAGREFRLGFQIPDDFPFTPPSGPHVSPHLHPILPGGVHPTGGILPSHDRSEFGHDFQYWSRPFPDWASTKRRAPDYMAFIRHLWATQ